MCSLITMNKQLENYIEHTTYDAMQLIKNLICTSIPRVVALTTYSILDPCGWRVFRLKSICGHKCPEPE